MQVATPVLSRFRDATVQLRCYRENYRPGFLTLIQAFPVAPPKRVHPLGLPSFSVASIYSGRSLKKSTVRTTVLLAIPRMRANLFK